MKFAAFSKAFGAAFGGTAKPGVEDDAFAGPNDDGYAAGTKARDQLLQAFANAPPAYLKPTVGDLAGREFPIAKTLLSIGRGLDNDLVIDDPRVSRHHSQITFRHSHYLLRDLRSTNGTFVNGQPVEAVVLASGDIVSIGGFEMLFEQE